MVVEVRVWIGSGDFGTGIEMMVVGRCEERRVGEEWDLVM